MPQPAQSEAGALRALRERFSPAVAEELPDRVKAIVEEQDRAGERLIGYVQLGIGAMLWMLYLLAPRPNDAPMSMLAPVPLALSVYTTFSLVRLWLILRRRAPGWFVGLSISVDVGLVLALIWSFHLQYGQAPGFALKAPTFVYLFMLIALRALRFDPRYVLAAGCVGALGWALLTAVVVLASGPGTVTHSFTDYLTTGHILVGAEVEKILAVLTVTALLALSVSQAQRTLVAAVREEAAVKEIRRFLSKGVADRIARSDTLIEAGHAVERQAAILMIDIRGFTPFAMRVPAREVVRILTTFHARVIPVVRANRGVVDKFLGDGVMATFGAVDASGTAAADALNALDAVLAEARDWQKELKSLGVSETLVVNAAVAAGPVVFATLGDGDRLEYTVIGEAVNLAAKLEKHNKVEKCRALTTAETMRMAESQGYAVSPDCSPRPAARVAGVEGAIDLVAWVN